MGDQVRVKTTVSSPMYGWGAVSHNSIGTVRRLGSSTMVMKVDFPDHSGWSANPDEMEKVSSCGASRVCLLRCPPFPPRSSVCVVVHACACVCMCQGCQWHPTARMRVCVCCAALFSCIPTHAIYAYMCVCIHSYTVVH